MVLDNDGILVTTAGKKISTLSIDSVQAQHAGTYTCVAKNRAGSTSYAAELLVNGTSFSFCFNFSSYFSKSFNLFSCSPNPPFQFWRRNYEYRRLNFSHLYDQ